MFGIAVAEGVVLGFWVIGLVALVYGVTRGRLDRLTGLLALAAVAFIPVLGSALVLGLVARRGRSTLRCERNSDRLEADGVYRG